MLFFSLSSLVINLSQVIESHISFQFPGVSSHIDRHITLSLNIFNHGLVPLFRSLLIAEYYLLSLGGHQALYCKSIDWFLYDGNFKWVNEP